MDHKIIKPIYIRKGPGKSFDSIGIARPGDDFVQMDGTVTGETLKGLDQWHFKINDLGEKNYYWEGGTAAQLHWSLRFFGIDKIWERTMGDGIRVAVIDSGVNLKNTDFKLFAGFNVIDNSKDVQDSFFHGTYCSTILCSKGLKGVYGVAPGIDLISIKIANRQRDLSNEQYKIDGINKAINLGAQIISISFGTTQENPRITEVLNKAMSQGIICIAAAGNNRSRDVEYPANIKGMISVGNVGCLNPNAPTNPLFFLSNNSAKGNSDKTHEGITVIAPGDGLSTYDLNDNIITNIDGTSYAAPYVAGLAALWLSANKLATDIDNPHQDFKKLITTTANKDIDNYNQSFFGEGLINPTFILSNQVT